MMMMMMVMMMVAATAVRVVVDEVVRSARYGQCWRSLIYDLIHQAFAHPYQTR